MSKYKVGDKVTSGRMIDINVGDFVETIDGKVGYVFELNKNDKYGCICVQLYNGDTYYYNYLLDEEYDYKKQFKRIGSHDFTVKENKIEPLPNMDFICGNNKILDCNMNKHNVFEMYDKINEIIAYINKEK